MEADTSFNELAGGTGEDPDGEPGPAVVASAPSFAAIAAAAFALSSNAYDGGPEGGGGAGRGAKGLYAKVGGESGCIGGGGDGLAAGECTGLPRAFESATRLK